MRLNYNGQLFNYQTNKYLPSPEWDMQVKVEKKNQSATETISATLWGKLINSTHLPSYYIINSKNYNIENVKDDLEFLNARLDYLRKTITYWDTYNIQGVIDDNDNLSKIESLEVGRSWIINRTTPFVWQGQTCTRGGAFVNTLDQGIVYIPSQAAGIYKPYGKEILNDDKIVGMNITYQFTDNSNDLASNSNGTSFSFINDHYYNFSGAVITGDTTSGFTIWDGKIKAFENENEENEASSFILPVVNFTLNNEEIWIDHIIKETTNADGKQYEIEWVADSLEGLANKLFYKVK